MNSFLKSEALFDALRNIARVAEIRFQAARTLRALGNRARASTMLRDALAAASSAGNESLAIRIQAFAGLAQAQDGDVEGASARLDDLVRRLKGVDDPQARFAAQFAHAKVVAEVALERGVAALKTLATALEDKGPSPELADVYDELGKVLSRQGRADQGVIYAQKAYAMTFKRKGVT